MKQTLLAIALVLAISSQATAETITYYQVPGHCPSYKGFNGCAPTAGGMIMGWWDAYKSKSNLFSASAPAIYDTANCTADIGSLAIYMGTSSGGTTPTSNLVPGMKNFASHQGYSSSASLISYVPPLGNTDPYCYWTQLKNELSQGYPILATIDRDGNATNDHAVTILGWAEGNAGTKQYYSYDGWSETEGSGTWHNYYASDRYGSPWLIRAIVRFRVTSSAALTAVPEPSSLALAGLGLLGFAAFRRMK